MVGSASDLKDRIESLYSKFDEIKKVLDLESKKNKIKELEAQSLDPDFWQDKENAKNILQKLAGFKEEISEVEKVEKELSFISSLSQDDLVALNVSEDIDSLEDRIKKLEITTFFSGRFDQKNAIVSLHAGQGGTEAMDWTSMLFRMYLRFCEKKGWTTTTIDISEGEEAGLKSVTFKVEGVYAYGYLKNEAGTHRLVRQSPFNADKLRHTSFALVGVLPELEETDLPEIVIKEEDLEWSFFRSSGKGGQNVQKVSTAVRLKHIPTGIVVCAQTERFQEQNRRYALEHLRALLWMKKQEEEQTLKKSLKGTYRPASWGNQIRSYILHPYKMVKDLRTGYEESDPQAVLDGELDGFIQAELRKFGSK